MAHERGKRLIITIFSVELLVFSKKRYNFEKYSR
jgi:hypothetical protein